MKFEIFGYKINIEKKALETDSDMPQDLKEALKVLEKYGKKIPASPKKIASASRASAIKAKRAKEKVLNAINLLRLEGKEITAYQIAKTAEISYNTAKKYLKELN